MGKGDKAGRLTVVAAVAATALAGAALLASPAAAAKKKAVKPGKLETASSAVTTTTNAQQVTVSATCPKGTAVIGGGYSTGVAVDGGTFAGFHLVMGSRRTAARTWSITAIRFSSPTAGPTQVRAEAYCRSGAGKVAQASETFVTGDATSFATGAAACGSKKTSVGGGFLSSVPGPPATFEIFHLVHRPVGASGWMIALLGGEDGITTTVDALCRKGKVRSATRNAAGALSTTAPGSVATTITPNCPNRLFPFAGGFGSNFSSGAGLPMFVESLRSGRGWKVSALNLTPNPGAFTAYSLCS